jgi:DNA-binding beta-propeller fold protein YncE
MIPAQRHLLNFESPPRSVPATIALLALLVLVPAGCVPDTSRDGELEAVWGQFGTDDGQFQKPRAIAIDNDDNLYIVDFTARIQVYTPEGQFLRGWRTPESTNGRPTGLAIAPNGNVLVADTHYYRVLIYSPQGKLLDTIGGKRGHGPGEFGFVTDVLQDAQGNYYVAEYGEYDRIQKFSPDKRYILEWGGHGSEPGQFIRPQKMILDEQNRIWVADACNHRIQVFDTSGKLLLKWGEKGSAPGQLSYPYDLTFDRDGNLLLIEYANHRVQKFSRDGKSLGCWGTHGRGPGQMHNPWGLVCDSQGRIHVLDSNNHRVQRIRL